MADPGQSRTFEDVQVLDGFLERGPVIRGQLNRFAPTAHEQELLNLFPSRFKDFVVVRQLFLDRVRFEQDTLVR